MKSKSDKNQAKLPWWVELLFVQIGLPDSWLSKYLKKRKEAANYINENKKYLYLCTLLISGVLYIYPVVKYTSLTTSCINKTSKYLKSTNINNPQNKIDINSIAVGYCHGGPLPK
tara:strand:- start:585 stop:929 length:345 start_codon:yes stop_codon:yes gene_type:complete